MTRRKGRGVGPYFPYLSSIEDINPELAAFLDSSDPFGCALPSKMPDRTESEPLRFPTRRPTREEREVRCERDGIRIIGTRHSPDSKHCLACGTVMTRGGHHSQPYENYSAKMWARLRICVQCESSGVKLGKSRYCARCGRMFWGREVTCPECLEE